MNSTLEKRNTQPTMEKMKVMQQTALSRSIDKAANIQKAVTLTEANWTGLIEALELTGRSALKLQDTMDRLITNEDLDMMLKAQVKSLMGQYQTAVYNIQTAAGGAEQKLCRTFEEDGRCHRPQSEPGYSTAKRLC